MCFVFSPFHPRKLGPDRMVLYKAASCIQRWVRGWLIRIKIQALRRKVSSRASLGTALIKPSRLWCASCKLRVDTIDPNKHEAF